MPPYLFMFLTHLLEVLKDLHLVGAQLAEEAGPEELGVLEDVLIV